MHEVIDSGLDVTSARAVGSGSLAAKLGLEASGKQGTFLFGEVDYSHRLTEGLSLFGTGRGGIDTAIDDWRAELYTGLRFDW